MTAGALPSGGTLTPVTRRFLPCTRAIAPVCAAALLVAAPACAVRPKPAGSPKNTGAVAGTSAFEPVELRIHPLTRIRESSDGVGHSVDLYFELLDRWGHGVKALGTLTVELRAINAGGQREPFQVRSWTVALSEPGVNSAAYDRVTRTYHIVLEDVPAGSDGSELLARFRGSHGNQIVATYDLR